MGSITKTPQGTWRAAVKKAGVRRSKTFARKSDAEKWKVATEAKINVGDELPSIAKDTVETLVRRYIEEECSGPDRKWDRLRLQAFLKDAKGLARKQAARASHDDFEAWVEARKKQVQEATVLRELNVVSGVFTHAIKKWKVKLPRHPTRGMDKPKKGKSRRRRPSLDELKRLREYKECKREYTLKWYAPLMFELGCETGMRIGEMVLIKPHDLHLDEHWLHLPKTKNGDERDVPLSDRAVELIKEARRGSGPPFPLNKASLDSVWRDLCTELGIVDLHFHDSRHEACSRLSRIYDVLTLAKVIGHRDLKSLMVYYNPTPAELARQLRGGPAATPSPPPPPTTASS
jgi:integrase